MPLQTEDSEGGTLQDSNGEFAGKKNLHEEVPNDPNSEPNVFE
jgi:hypothetical protein